MIKVVFATHNKNKLKEVREILGDSFEVIGLEDLDFFDEIAETADTIEGNAKLKADFIHHRFNVNCIADDTGLEVEALDGRPGIYSARYAGEEANDAKNVEKLLSELKNKTNRKASFKTVIVFIYKGKTHLFEGIVKGEILEEPVGNNGFGYDPIFQPLGYDKSFAQMSSTEKNAISHRAMAVNSLKKYIETQILKNRQ